ncbi:MAG TPA: efflux RND transporter periplasmic adaptor subunit, partial [Polyangiales bacterium]|nr:efflux RND transporter periplasmic adaptor subunit [Polyangiales bacterium]
MALLTACTRTVERGEKPAPKRIACAPVERTTERDEIELRGTLMPLPDRYAQLAPQLSGRVLKVDVREGDAVSVGQVVARIDDAIAIDEARQSDAALVSAHAETQHSATTLERVERVFERGIVPKQEVDDASAKHAAAIAAETAAESVAHQAHRQIERATLRSPLRGTVLKVFRKPGELVDGTPATPVLEIADLTSLELIADAPVQDLSRIRAGAAAAISFNGISDRVRSGSVVRVAPAIDRATGLGSVRIAVDHAVDLALPVGTLGLARVQSGSTRSAFLVPTRSLRGQIGEEADLIVCGDDRQAHAIRVHIGQTRA